MYRQIFKLIVVKNTVNKILTENLYFKVLQHELPEVDFTQGRGTLDKNTVFKSVSYYFLNFYMKLIFNNITDF